MTVFTKDRHWIHTEPKESNSHTHILSMHFNIIFWSSVKRSELRWSSWRQSTMHIRLTLYWGYLIVVWLFHLVCILCCGCLNWFCNVWVCVCVGVCMCGFCNVWVCVCVGVCMSGCFGNMCTCIYCALYCLYCVFVLFLYVYLFLFVFVCTNVRTTATEWQLNCSK